MVYSRVVDQDALDIIEFCGTDIILDKLINKTFLITGASGMVGSYIIYTLLKLNELYDANIQIKAVVRNPQKLDRLSLIHI